MQTRVYLRGVTWSRDSHGLFDYEAKTVTKRSWNTWEPSRVLRQENDIQI